MSKVYNRLLLKRVSMFLWSVGVLLNLEVYGQCTGETATIINQCSGQQPQVAVTPVGGNTDYKWFVGGSLFGTGGDFTYQNPLSGSLTINYQKEVTATGGPTAGSGTYTVPSSGTVVSTNYSVSVNSTTSFKLNSLTVPVKLYSCDPTKIYRLKVIVGPLASPTSASVWYNFTCSSLISTSEGQTYLVKMDVNTSATVPGLVIPSGATTVSVVYNDGTANPANVSDLSGLVAFSTASFNNTYSIGTTTITHSSSGNRPAFLDWNITTICGQVPVVVNSASGTGCCVPGNVNVPSIISSTGTSVIDTDPVSPALTLSTPLQSGYYYQWYKNNTAIGTLTQNGNTLTVNSSGTYSVRIVEKSTDVKKSACYKEDLFAISKRVLFAEADKTNICLGETVQLNAKGATGNTASSIIWSPSTGISNVNSKTPTFIPTTTGKKILTVDAEVPVGNQVVNGDFESSTAADAKFNYSSYYHYVDPSTSVPTTTPATYFGIPNRRGVNWLQNGNFSIYNYVFSNNDGYTGIKPCTDHTTGTGNLLFTDAASKNISSVSPTPAFTDTYIWSQQVTLQAGQTYEFSSWFTNVNSDYCACTDPFDGTVNAAKSPSGQPQVNFYVNDVLVNPTPITITGATCQWQKVSYNYVAPISGTTSIKIVEISRADAGNDFAIDDIAFGAPGRQTDTISILVNDCDVFNATATCNSGVLTLKATTTNGIFDSWAHIPTSGSASTVTITDPKSATSTATPIATTKEYEATFKFIRGNQVANPDYSTSGKNGTTMTDRSSQAGAYGFSAGEYEIGIAPATYSNTADKIYVNVPDHTTGSTTNFNYLSGSGIYSAGKNIVFSQTISTTNGSEYAFSAWLANIHKEFTKASPDTIGGTYPNGAKSARFELYIGGTLVKKLTLTPNTSWNELSYIYKATSTANVTFELRIPTFTNTNSLDAAFAIDDVSIGAVDTRKKTVTTPCTTPVTFTYFTLNNAETGVGIYWGTASEQDMALFIVQRSRDGYHFEDIAWLKPKVSGTDYSSLDSKPQEGTLYYRIKEQSKKGDISYTNVLTISRLDDEEVSVYPNPSHENFTVYLKGQEGESIQARILGTEGTELQKLVLQTNVNNSLGGQLSAGLYLLEIRKASGLVYLKIVKE